MSTPHEPPNPFRQATFLLSVNHLRQLPDDHGLEVAFAGRSNAGKSSALNLITDNGALARVSKTPGRTQMINYFTVDASRRLVDLPGYGFAKVPPEVKRHWQQILEQYLRSRASLRGLMIVMDCRHPLKEYDRQMLEWCRHRGMQVHILLTKADKLSRGAAGNTLQQVRAILQSEFPHATAQLFSSLNGTGAVEARQLIATWLEIESGEQK
ncbi:MAG TPA: ribosome biogenesis GTP-binding protein YihA/YsxC [Gammaproteobacteria bacterium]